MGKQHKASREALSNIEVAGRVLRNAEDRTYQGNVADAFIRAAAQFWARVQVRVAA